jgi:uncharacterized protein (DUF2236 family)
MKRTKSPPNMPKDAILRTFAAEPHTIFGGGRALMLQLADPKVCQGVADHSGFEVDPLPRLLGTLDFLSIMVWGTQQEAADVRKYTLRVHNDVKGVVQEGRLEGQPYNAHDPALLAWVNATLFQTTIEMWTRMRGPLPPERVEQIYQEFKQVAVGAGLALANQPKTYADFEAYWQDKLASLEVTELARKLAQPILHPQVLPAAINWVLWPAAFVFRLFTIGLLPESVCEDYGFRWTAGRDRLFRLLFGVIRLILLPIPGPVRRAPAVVTVPVMRWTRWTRYRELAQQPPYEPLPGSSPAA